MTTLEETIYAAEFTRVYNAQMESRTSRIEFGDVEGFKRARERAITAAHNRATYLVEGHRAHAPKETL